MKSEHGCKCITKGNMNTMHLNLKFILQCIVLIQGPCPYPRTPLSEVVSFVDLLLRFAQCSVAN